jgi:hypothetical protein
MTLFARSTLRLAVAAAFAGALPGAHAAGPAASAPAAAASVDAEKQKLIDQLLTIWHPENAIVAAVQRPGYEALEKSRIAMQQNHLPADKFEKNMKDISTDVQKYVDAASPLVIASAKKNSNAIVVPALAQNFTADELRQLIALLQSPLRQKFEKLVPQIDQTLGKKVQEEVGPEVNKHIQVLTEAVGTKLRAAITTK